MDFNGSVILGRMIVYKQRKEMLNFESAMRKFITISMEERLVDIEYKHIGIAATGEVIAAEQGG